MAASTAGVADGTVISGAPLWCGFGAPSTSATSTDMDGKTIGPTAATAAAPSVSSVHGSKTSTVAQRRIAGHSASQCAKGGTAPLLSLPPPLPIDASGVATMKT